MKRFYYAWAEGRSAKIRFIWFKGRPYLILFWDEIHWTKIKFIDYCSRDVHEFEHNYYIPAWQWKGAWYDGDTNFMLKGIKREVKEEMVKEIGWNDFIYHPFRKHDR